MRGITPRHPGMVLCMLCASFLVLSVAGCRLDVEPPPDPDTTLAGGRFVVFDSLATNLVAGDTNFLQDVFLKDRQTGVMVRASVGPGGAQGNGISRNPSVSGDGRFVVFESFASSLVASDSNGARDVFVHDVQTGITALVSVDSLENQGDSDSNTARISTDGRYVVFQSSATNLVTGDTNGSDDVFVRDLVAGTTERVSVDSLGTQAGSDSADAVISGDGRYVAFESSANNLVGGDTNNGTDVFVRDRQTGTTTRVSLGAGQTEGNLAAGSAAISEDGRYVAFHATSTNLVPNDTNGNTDVFVRDRQANTTTRVSVRWDGTEANSASWDPSISGDGKRVSFWSSATNLVSADSNGAIDVFLSDAGTVVLVSTDGSAIQSNGDSYSYNSSVSRDGVYVVFWSSAVNLVTGDTNGSPDIFAKNVDTGVTSVVSVDSAGVQQNNAGANPATK